VCCFSPVLREKVREKAAMTTGSREWGCWMPATCSSANKPEGKGRERQVQING